jgi:ribosome-associated toxin RatA of RatAB toxin-antitoxin module
MAFSRLAAISSDVFPCDRDLIYEVLTDYDSYSEWLPFIAKSRLLAQEGHLAITELDLVLPPDETLMMEWIQTTNTSVLGRVIGGMTPVSELEWKIEPAHTGHSVVTVAIKRNMNSRLLFPAHWTFMNAGKWMKALHSRIAVFLPELASPQMDGEKILELWDTEAGFVCWIRGKKFVLVDVPDIKRI